MADNSARWGASLRGPLLSAHGVRPVLLAVILLMISRPRPVQNLLAYRLGGMMVNIICLLIPLIVLHLIPTLNSPCKVGRTLPRARTRPSSAFNR